MITDKQKQVILEKFGYSWFGYSLKSAGWLPPERDSDLVFNDIEEAWQDLLRRIDADSTT